MGLSGFSHRLASEKPVAKLAQGSGFQLPDPFTGETEIGTDFLERAGISTFQREPLVEDDLLSRIE
jgi:hypothetical protein